MDDFFHELPSSFNENPNSEKFKIPVNIKETTKAYLLEIIAPGFVKEDFVIDLDKTLLTISAEKKNKTNDETDEKYHLNEYMYRGFKRSFLIDELID
jgi:HSP20 family protein